MALPELGAKQICPNCQAKFYDLSRRPAHCPKCGHDFDPDEAVRTRRVRARAAPVGRDIEDEAEDQVLDTGVEAEEEEEEAVTPELDAAVDDPVLVVDDEDGEVIAPPEDDLAAFQEEDDLDDEDAGVPFLEDEEDDFDDADLDGLPGEGGPDDEGAAGFGRRRFFPLAGLIAAIRRTRFRAFPDRPFGPKGNPRPRGYSSVGRALEWHSRGQRFDSA